jgi:DNA-binding MarR family transcriptional regulator
MTKALREEIRQTQPFRSLEQEAHLNIVRTAAVLTDQFEQLLAPFGITPSQYNVLRILRGAEPKGLCRNEVRDRMLTRMPDMTRLLDRMERAGLVVRTRGTEDRRLVSTGITEKGRQILDQLEAPVAAEHSRRLAHLSEAQLRHLIELLGQVRDGK